MKKNYIKQLFYITSILLAVSWFFPSCSELLPKPNAALDSVSTVNKDTTAALDSLPSFNNPTGVAVDSAGNIYVADYGNNLIRKISPKGVVSTFAGSGYTGSVNATGVLASFNKPADVAVDASGNLYVADSGNNLIRKISSSAVTTTLAGGDTLVMANGTGVNASFDDPLGIAADASGNVYVADAGNNAVRMITTAGLVSTTAFNDTTSNIGGNSNLLNNPTGVALDAHHNVFVANYLDNNIMEIINSSGALIHFAGDTLGTAGNNNGPAIAATFYYPNSIAVDAFNNVYVADGVNNQIREITSNGMVSTFAGSGDAGAIDGTGTAASFNGPAGLAVDAAGNIYVADANNNRIRKITPAGVVTTIAGSGLPGAKNGIALAHTNKTPLKISLKNRVNIFARHH